MASDLQVALARLRGLASEIYDSIDPKARRSPELELAAWMYKTSYPLDKVTGLFPESINGNFVGKLTPNLYRLAAEWTNSEVLEDFTRWIDTRAYDTPSAPWPRPNDSVEPAEVELARITGELLAGAVVPEAPEDELERLVELVDPETKGWGSW